MFLLFDLWFLAVSEKYVILVTFSSNPFEFMHLLAVAGLLNSRFFTHFNLTLSSRLCKEMSKNFSAPFTVDLCLVARGGCSHQCTVAPGKGVVCSCPPGLHLDSSNKTCEVVDYCSRHLKCSQVCEQYKTTVKCSCYPGWVLDPDGDSCHSTGTGAWRFNVCFTVVMVCSCWLVSVVILYFIPRHAGTFTIFASELESSLSHWILVLLMP